MSFQSALKQIARNRDFVGGLGWLNRADGPNRFSAQGRRCHWDGGTAFQWTSG